jgi:hypothetical protein
MIFKNSEPALPSSKYFNSKLLKNDLDPLQCSSQVGHVVVILIIDSLFSLLKSFFAFYDLPTIG